MNDAIVLRNIIIAFEYEVQDGRIIKHELRSSLVPDVLNAIIEYNPVSLSELSKHGYHVSSNHEIYDS